MKNQFRKLFKQLASALQSGKPDSQELPPNAPTAEESEFKDVMAEAAQMRPALVSQVDAFEQKLVDTFGIPVTHQVVSTPIELSCQPAWLGSKLEHLVLYSSDLPSMTLLRQRAMNLMHLQVQSECARANGWVIFGQNPTPGRARENYLKHGFGSAAKELVRAGHDEEEVPAAQNELIENMTSNLVNAIQFLMIGHRLSRELPGLLTENLLIPDYKTCNPGDAQVGDEFCGLAPQKIARRWRILQHAVALYCDGLTGTRQAEIFFKDPDGRDEAVRISDYCRQAIGTMKPGDEITITNEVMRMARLQDFLSLLKLQVDLEKVRNSPVAEATRPETVSTPETAKVWLEFLAHAEAELVRSAKRVGPQAISGIKCLSHGRHVILQGRQGETALAGFFTWDSEISKELPLIQKQLNGRSYESQIIEPSSGQNCWMLMTKFKPLKGYSMKDRISVGTYLTEQIEALDESYARN